MGYEKIMFIIKGDIKDDVASYRYDPNSKRMMITYKSGKTYPYAYDNVQILKEYGVVDIKRYSFTTKNGFVLNHIRELYEFKSGFRAYYRFFFENGDIRNYKYEDLVVSENALEDNKVDSLFCYYRKAASYNSLQTDDGEILLEKIYDKIGFVSADSVLAGYLKGNPVKNNSISRNAVFPFGCNLSQIAAVRNALTHNVSIIEGPPGTGKTQTILNIIANIVMNGKTVMVVSNNNPATDIVFEKLQKYGYSFIAAQMGSSKNKDRFINEKQTPYPDFVDYPNISNDFGLNADIGETTEKIKVLFEKKNRLAEIQTELSELELEQKYYLDYYESTFDDIHIFKRDRFTSDSLLDLWTELQNMRELGRKLGFIKRLIYKFRYGFVSINTLSGDTEKIIAYIKKPCLNMNEQTWIGCNVHMFEYFGGVTLRIVCDNLKTGVITHPREGDIVLNKSYEDFSNHYCTAIMPAGVRKPKQKASVEGTVGKIATAIIARLRNNEYTSLNDLKSDVAAALEDFNNKPFQKREGSRREVFEANEKISLRPLPAFPYEYAVWEYGRVIGSDFHVTYRNCKYSVPYRFVGKTVDLKITDSIIEIYCGHERISSHKRFPNYVRNRYDTYPEDIPERFRKTEWNEHTLREWAASIGKNTLEVIDRIFKSYRTSEQGINPSMSVLKLSKKYSSERLETACGLALEHISVPRYAHFKAILASGQDMEYKENKNREKESSPAGFVRGAAYYGGDDHAE